MPHVQSLSTHDQVWMVSEPSPSSLAALSALGAGPRGREECAWPTPVGYQSLALKDQLFCRFPSNTERWSVVHTNGKRPAAIS